MHSKSYHSARPSDYFELANHVFRNKPGLLNCSLWGQPPFSYARTKLRLPLFLGWHLMFLEVFWLAVLHHC